MNLALLDWDGSIRSGFTMRNWIQFLGKNHELHKDIVDNIERIFLTFFEGKLSHDKLINNTSRIYSADMEGKSFQDIKELASLYFLEDQNYIFSFANFLFEKLRNNNIYSIIISGAPKELLLQYKTFYPFDEIYGLELEEEAGILTGEIKSNAGILETKNLIVNAIKKQVDRKVIFAIGNSESDAPLLDAAFCSVVVDNCKLKPVSKTIYLSSQDSLEEQHKVIDLIESFLPKVISI